MKVTTIGHKSQRNPSRQQTSLLSNGWKITRSSDRSGKSGERFKRLRPEHMRMLNDKRWAQTKAIVKQRAKGLCEECKAEGYIVPGVDCHHVIPFESATNQDEMERLCYNPDNVRLLCIKHHIAVHANAGSHTKEAHQQRLDERFERWKARHERRPDAEDKPSGPHLSGK